MRRKITEFVKSFAVNRFHISRFWAAHFIRNIKQDFYEKRVCWQGGNARQRIAILGTWTAKISAPLCVMVVATMAIAYFGNTSYAFAVEKNGQVIAYVDSRDTVDKAKTIIENQLQQTVPESVEQPVRQEKKDQVQIQPAVEACVIPKDALIESDEQLAQKLVEQSSEQVAQLYGVTVDGKWMGGVESPEAVYQALDDIKAEYAVSVGADPATATFASDVQVKQGIYLAEVKSDDQAVVSALKGSAEQPSPVAVSAVVQTSYEEEVPYANEEQEDPDLAKGFEIVTQHGENGKVLQTAQVQLVNGVETNRTIVHSEPIEPAVNQITHVGTNTAQGLDYISVDGSPGVHFIRPTARGYMSQSAANGHNAVDIAGCGGDPIVASAAGIVTSACWHEGYGNCVFIDHGNGVMTVYGHMEEITVTEGQKVAQGEQIGIVGSTGRSTGPHVHFEIRANNQKLDPEKYCEI